MQMKKSGTTENKPFRLLRDGKALDVYKRQLGMNPVAGGSQEILADVPMTGMFGYCTTLRSMTGGRGTYSYEFARYEQAPSDVQEAEIAKRAEE